MKHTFLSGRLNCRVLRGPWINVLGWGALMLLPQLPAEAITVVHDQHYPPFVFRDPTNGEPAGLDIEVVREVAKEAGLVISSINLKQWEEARRDLEAGRADVIPGMVWTKERAELYDFTRPIMRNKTVIFVRKNTFDVHRLDDLGGEAVLVQKGDIAHDLLLRPQYAHLGLKLLLRNNQADALAALMRGEAKAAVGNYCTGRYTIGLRKWEAELKETGKPLLTENYCMAVRKGDRDLLAKLDNALKVMEAGGDLERLKSEWMGRDFVPPEEIKRLHLVATVLGASLGIAVAVGTVLGVLWFRGRRLARKCDYDIFLSYDHHDRAAAKEVATVIEGRGLACFMAERELRVGEEWETSIRSALRRSQRLLLLVTPNSLESHWVAVETGAAWAMKKDIVPALIGVRHEELTDPVRHLQARPVDTDQQRDQLARELAALRRKDASEPGKRLSMPTHNRHESPHSSNFIRQRTDLDT